MLRTNLATRPFYNERAVRVGLAVAAVLAVIWSVYTAARVVSLTARNGDLSGQAASAEGRVQELAAQSRQIRESLNRSDVSTTEGAAREANLLIDRRAFSWTSLFNRFEETLPGDVRIVAVRPQIDRTGRFVLAISVVSRSVEAVDAFITEMEKSGAFHNTLPVTEQLEEDDTFRSVIQTFYTPSAAKPATASESGESDGPRDTEVAPESVDGPRPNGAASGSGR
jgi:Tfp pilus assembly protein PilN